MNTAAHPAHVSPTQTSSQWSTPVSAQWLNISFRIRGSWSMQMPFRKEKVYTRTHKHMHTLTYTVSFPHGALQHKDCRLFIWEKFAHVSLPLLFCVTFCDFIVIIMTFSQSGNEKTVYSPRVPPPPALSDLNGGLWYYTCRKWGNSRSGAMIIPLITFGTTVYFLFCIFTNWLHFSSPRGAKEILYFEAISGKDYFNLSSRFFL